MKTSLFTLVALSTIFSMTSCSNEASHEITPSKYITVEAGLQTRVTATEFEKDDAISIYSWTGNTDNPTSDLIVNNSINTFDGSKWSATPMMLWKDMTTPHYFIGVHPTRDIENFNADVYEKSIDVLVATELTGRSAEGTNQGIVPLTFNHVMSKMIVNLKFRNQWETTPAISKVYTDALDGATVDYIIQKATGNGNKGVELAEATPNVKYEAIVSPQSIYKIDITIEGKIYTYNNAEGIEMVGGKIQTINLIVGRDQIDLGSVIINSWTDGETINGGEAQEENIV